MTEHTDTPRSAAALDAEAAAAWVSEQRWYASKSRAIAALDVDEFVEISADPSLAIAIVQARFATGAHETYQLPLSLIARGAAEDRSIVAGLDGGDRVAVDALTDPESARTLLRAMDSELTIETDEGTVHFSNAAVPLPLHEPARPIGVEQSNSSIVFGSETVLKVFRRLEPGINPELEMLRFLTAHEFAAIAPLHGAYEYDGRAVAATLGVAQRFYPDATGGWELALAEIRADPAAFIVALGALGRVTAELHNVLGSDAGDPAFSPEEPSAESLALLTATIDEEIERVFMRLPDDERTLSILGRGQDVREQLTQRAQLGEGGRLIRCHGDYHLGQTLHRGVGGGKAGSESHPWVIIDFEGEPARPLFERRQKASPLRDVAGMLRSIAYATSAAAIMFGQPAPGQFEDRARQTFLESYFSTIEPSLLPAGENAILNLLAIFELEKAVYELQYELDNRPDWLPIPVAGIARLLETE